MKKILYFLMAVAALAMFGCTGDSNLSAVVNPNGSALSPTGTIQGHLTDSCTGTPIANAVVDIGLGRATTSSTGQFVIYNVPATKQADSSVRGEYSATIDLRNAAAPDGTSLKGQYPDFTYRDMKVVFTTLNGSGSGTKGQDGSDIGQVVSGNNPAVPVVGLVSGDQDVKAGKKASTIKGIVQVPDATDSLYTPGANYFVWLTDWRGNVVGAVQRSGQDGSFSFGSLENGADFIINASKLDPNGSVDPTSDFSNLGDQKSDIDTRCGEVIFANVTVSKAPTYPCLIAQTPGQYENIAVTSAEQTITDFNGKQIVVPAGSVIATFNFNSAIAANSNNGLLPTSATNDQINTLALTSVGNPGSLFAKTEVLFLGFKAGNVAHQLVWETTSKLDVIIPNAAKGAIYHVDITDALNTTAGPVIASECGPTGAITFYTFGAEAVTAAPTLQGINRPYDYDGGPGDLVVLSWNPVAYAKGYNVYCQLIQNYPGENPQVGQPVQMLTWPGLTSTAVIAPNFPFNKLSVWTSMLNSQWLTSLFVENNSIQITYSCYVKGVNADGLEGPASSPLLLADEVKPRLKGTYSQQTVGTDYQFDLCFSEPMDKAEAQKTTNYVFQNISTNHTAPTINSAVYSEITRCTRLHLSKAVAAGDFRPNVANLLVSGLDVAQNPMDTLYNFFMFNVGP